MRTTITEVRKSIIHLSQQHIINVLESLGISQAEIVDSLIATTIAVADKYGISLEDQIKRYRAFFLATQNRYE